MGDYSEFDCIVVGAGVSGIAAAQLLDQKGFRVVVVEARERIGGRIKTTHPGDGKVAVELGAQWIHGIDGNKNPLLHLIPDISVPTDHSKTLCYNKDGSLIPLDILEKCNQAIQQLQLEFTTAYKHGTRGSILGFMHTNMYWNTCIFGTCPPEKPLTCQSCQIKLFLAKNFENVEGGRLDDVSIGEFAGEGGFHGENVIPMKGYLNLLQNIIEGLNRAEFRLGCEVLSIDYNHDFVKVETTHGPITARSIISTLPLGVLKSKQHCPRFHPPLPHTIQRAIQKLGFGLLDKTVLTFEKAFWPSETQGFLVKLDCSQFPGFKKDRHGHGDDEKEAMLWFFNLKESIHSPGDHDVLVCYYAADVADWMEGLKNEEIQELLVNQLGIMFGSSNVTPLKSIVVTRWRRDRFSLGSYSYLSKESEFEDQAAFEKPILFGSNRRGGGIFAFAGEHTIRTHFATVHGGLLSGQRAGKQVIQHFLGNGEKEEVGCSILLGDEKFTVEKPEAEEEEEEEEESAYCAFVGLGTLNWLLALNLEKDAAFRNLVPIEEEKSILEKLSTLDPDGELPPELLEQLGHITTHQQPDQLIAGLLKYTKNNVSYRGRLVQLVGRSHECDFPDWVTTLPALTAARTTFTTSRETNNQVSKVFETENSLYTVDEPLLKTLTPDVIVAQDTCKVCSIDLQTLEASCGQQIQGSITPMQTTNIISVNSKTLKDALITSIAFLGKELDMEYEAGLFIAETQARLNELKSLITPLTNSPRLALIEWIDPLFLGSGWTAELVRLAGGDLVGASGRHPDSVLENLSKGLGVTDIDYIIVCLCGLDSTTALKELKESKLIRNDSWFELAAVKKNQVFVVDGNSMFHRPTTRLLDALEWLIYTLRGNELAPGSKEFPVLRCDTREWKGKSSVVPNVEKLSPEIEECHRAACDRKDAFYTDSTTGYSVMTEYYLKQRQMCCGNACRHCPYGHARVKDPRRRKNVVKATVYLNPPPTKTRGDLDSIRGKSVTSSSDTRLVVLFWSGGRDSLLVLAHLLETSSTDTQVVLLTTIDPDTNQVSGQGISTAVIGAQSLSLKLPICLVPVSATSGNDAYVKCIQDALKLIKTSTKSSKIDYIVVGETRSRDIKEWRQTSFSSLGVECKFPLFGQSENDFLFPKLMELCDDFNVRSSLMSKRSAPQEDEPAFDDYENDSIASDNNDDDGNGSDGGEVDLTAAAPAAKKQKKDSSFKAPTNDEIQQLKETTDLFQSNLFRLQINELLSEVSLDHTKTNNLDKALHGIKAVLDQCKDKKDLDFAPAIVALAKQGVNVPFPSGADKPNPNAIKYKLAFKTPEKVFIAGSYLVKTVAKSRNGFNVDVAVQMPNSMFTEKDHINNRYFYKRAYYLAVIAAALRKKPEFANISFELLNKDPRRPIIVITSAAEDKASGGFSHLGGSGGVKIRIIPVISTDLFPVHKLAPSRNNNRPASSGDDNNNATSLPPTPRYNTSILLDTTLISHLNALHKQAASCPAFRDAVILGKVWLNQRGLESFGGFLWSLVIVYLLGNGNKVNKSTGVILRESYSSYQIVKLTIEFLANHNFADEPLFMTPDGLPIDHPDFSAQSFTKQFDCVIVDSTGRINLAAFVNASTLNHLQFEARASLKLFNDLGGDRFDSLFLKNLTEPIGYYDLVIRVDKIPSSFAAYKSGIQLDFPSKRQFFSHFVTRLLKLAIKSRTHLIKVTDVNQQSAIAWEVDEDTPDDDEESAVFIGLILNPETACEPVEQGPASGEDAKLVENFRRIWGTKSSLRRFNDGSIVESVVWETDGTSEGNVLITGQMASYLVGRHVSVLAEDISFWGGQFVDLLKEFGGHTAKSEAEKRISPFTAATEAFNAFAKAIKGLEGIPLDVTGVVPCDSGLRSSSVFIPQPALAGVETSRLTPILKDSLEVLIDFESSTKWPDTIPALQNMKLAFYIKLAELIASNLSGALATVTKPDLVDLTSGYLNVRMPSGYSFRARMRTGLEIPMSAKALRIAQSTQEPSVIQPAVARFHAVDKVYRAIASHSHRFQNVHYRYTQLSTTVRLVKRWLAAHWLAPHFTEEAIEILVVKVFVEHAPYPTAPACAFTGFMRVLELLWKWDFEGEPLIVEFEKNELTTEKRAEIRFNFNGKTDQEQEEAEAAAAQGGEDEGAVVPKKKAVVHLSTLDDLTGVFWTQDGPSLIVLKRVKQLAKASFKLLKEAVMVGDDEEVVKIFITPTEGYDYIIQLDVSKLSKYHQNISYDEEALPKSKSKFKNLAALNKDPLQRFLEEFNPVEKYLVDLQRAFGETMAFFYDVNGGDRIGVLLNKKIVVPLQPWKVNLPYSVKPVLEDDQEDSTSTKKGKKDGDKKKKEKKKKAMVAPDYASIGAEIERLGLGLVQSVVCALE
ncbi:UNVERIFIED_CONTAM: hypothetical protein HDU68_010401 [Siphonaria sp. JEL0065]|nr:hypothetical protein HDU68_010401 [Siphonaria sp. JEL0065]